MLLTNSVQISKRILESPINEVRHNQPYRWKLPLPAICTSEKKYGDIPLVFSNADTVNSIEPSMEYMEEYIKTEDDVVFYKYKFNMNDFGMINCKISTDLCNDENGELYLDELDAYAVSFTQNPLEEPFYVLREEDGTLHLQNKFEEFAELQRRGYTGEVWVIIADYCKPTI